MTYYSGFSGLGCGCGGKCGCGAKQNQAPLAEYYFEDTSRAEPGNRSSGMSGYGEGAAPITRTIKIVAKSFIARIGSGFGTPTCSGLLVSERMRLLALGTDAAYSENPLTDAKDKRCRLFSSQTFNVTCSAGQIISVTPGPIDTDAGTECIPHTPICLQPPPLVVLGVRSGPTSPGIFEFTWTAKGRPHPRAEPAFQAVCPRTSMFIWHRVSGTIKCVPNDIRVDVKIIGSRFPSHRVFVNGVATGPTIPQGPMTDLWVPAGPADPTLVR